MIRRLRRGPTVPVLWHAYTLAAAPVVAYCMRWLVRWVETRSVVAQRTSNAAPAGAAHAASARMFGIASSMNTHTHAQTPDATLWLAMGFYLPYRSAHVVRRRHIVRERPVQGFLSAPHCAELPCPRVSVDIMAAGASHELKPPRNYELLRFADDKRERGHASAAVCRICSPGKARIATPPT